MVLAITLLLLHWIPGFDLETLRVFNLPIGKQGPAAIMAILTIGLLYNSLSFAYFIYRDYRPWLSECLKGDASSGREIDPRKCFPEVRMFYCLAPRDLRNKTNKKGAVLEEWKYIVHRNTSPQAAEWVSPAVENQKSWRLELAQVWRFRERHLWFWLYEFSVPLAVATLAAVQVFSLYGRQWLNALLG